MGGAAQNLNSLYMPLFLFPPSIFTILLVCVCVICVCAHVLSHVSASSVCGTFPGRNDGVSCHFHLQGNLPDQGIELTSPDLTGRFFNTEPPGKPHYIA